ncbi:hypothetical protein [Actinomadura sp. DC4]|uniref:hypothetical protein n=1 Tax=Actinomadura sp. DC4 TaxID=3055069 RepID=UPI0025AEE43E|nr:hypothetical protein [Actinomadura sp. DC4]MDN3352981.1 hypothetical protein [Actinomadura sp. DC4]
MLLLFAAVALALLPTAASASAPTRGHVVLIGVPGLQWGDIHDTATPNLARLAGQGSSAALSVKTVGPHTCPIDGWLTISAGQRSQLRNGSCGLPPAPEGNAVPGFAAMRDDNAHNKYKSQVGLLGDAVHTGGGCTMAIGPGAVLGAADSAGRVDGYVPSTEQIPADGLTRCALTVVDIDDVFHAYIDAGVDVNGDQAQVAAKKRAAAVKSADTQVGQVLTSLPPDTTVLLAGLSDANVSAHLRVAIASGPGYSGHYLTADSTHTSGLVTLTDVTATVLHSLGLKQPSDAVGSRWRDDGAKPASVGTLTKRLNDHDVAAQSYSRLVLPFYLALVIVQVALYAFGTFALTRKRRRVLAATRVAALAGASLPAAAFLANLVPWWSAGHPAVVLVAAIVVAIGVITGIALAGPWRRSITGAGAIVGGVTALVLTLDVLTGSHLQTCSMLGYTPLVAGRFYGFGNIPWALFVTGLIIVTGAVAEWLLRSGRRTVATAAVIASGVLALVIDGAPFAGADFGGIIAIIPGFAVFAMMIAGRKVRLSRLLIVLAGGAVFVLAVSFLDSLRADPTHIGEFWKSLMNGDAGTIIARKLRGMLGTFVNWELSLIAVAAVAFLIFALLRPLAWRAAVLHTAYERAPALRPTLVAVLVTAGVGMLVNDSGVAIPALAFTVAIPLALVASIQAIGPEETTAPPPRSERSESAPAPKA